jgi:hypothetical protein
MLGTTAGCSPVILLAADPHEIPLLVAFMPSPENDRAARILRLNTHRENIIFALLNVELSDEQAAALRAQLSSAEDELVLLAGVISAN